MDKVDEKQFDCIVFDLGGVLIELGGISDVIGWSNKIKDEASLWKCWLSSPTIMAFESGKMTLDDFVPAICEELKLKVPPHVFMASFYNWPKGLYSGAEELLVELSSSYQLACLSNTSDPHWEKMCREMNVNSFFKEVFLSFQMGCVKPGLEIYQKMIKKLRLPPERILYFDDNLVNVNAAKIAGLTAVHTKGIDEVGTYLKENLIL